MTAFGSMETAIAAIRAGAYDFVTKPIELELLAVILRRAIERRQLQEQVRLLRETVQSEGSFEELLGQSSPMSKFSTNWRRLSIPRSRCSSLAKAGRAKNWWPAQSINEAEEATSRSWPSTAARPCPIHCWRANSLDIRRVRSPNARNDRKGLFVQAEGGTLLLDEIGDMPLSMQPKLLRALEENKVRPVGSDKGSGLRRAYSCGHQSRTWRLPWKSRRFREDLFFRIDVIQVEVSPLRARGTDALLLWRSTSLVLPALQPTKNVLGMSETVAKMLLAYFVAGQRPRVAKRDRAGRGLDEI